MDIRYARDFCVTDVSEVSEVTYKTIHIQGKQINPYKSVLNYLYIYISFSASQRFTRHLGRGQSKKRSAACS